MEEKPIAVLQLSYYGLRPASYPPLPLKMGMME